MDKTSVLSKIKTEKGLSNNAITTARMRKREEWRLYFDFNDDEIKSNMIYSYINQAMSVYYQDERSVVYTWDYLIDDIIDNLNNTAQSDYNNMWLNEIQQAQLLDCLVYGVWIIMKTWFNEVECLPELKTIDPLSRYPDPYCWNNEQQARWHWFMMRTSLNEIKQAGNYSESECELLKAKNIENENSARDNAAGQVNDLWFTDDTVIDVYYHFTQIDGKKYMYTTDADCQYLLRWEEILQTDDDAKQWVSYWPINIKWFSPKRWLPYGISMIDILKDKQRAKDFFLRLKKLKAAKEALWGDMIIDTSKGLNPTRIKDNHYWLRIHPVTLQQWERLDNVMYQLPQERLTTNLMDSFTQDVDQNSYVGTGISSASLWVQSEQNITATEVKTSQANANIRLLLYMVIQSMADQRFWEILWYNQMVIHMKESDKKYVTINDWLLWGTSRFFGRSDLITWIKPRIKMIQKSQLEAENNKLLQQMEVMYQTEMQDPWLSDFSKRQMKKRIWKLKGATKQEIQLFTQPSDPRIIADEMNAFEHVALINYNEVPMMKADEDHITYLAIYQRAENTEAKKTAILKRRHLMQLVWWQSQTMGWSDQIRNSAANIAISQNMTKNDTQSLPSNL